MAKHTVNITGTTDNQLLGRIRSARGLSGFGGSVYVKINSGSGTVKIQTSPDGGTTKYTVKDTGGVEIETSSNAFFNFVHGVPNSNSDFIDIYADLSSGSNADIDVILFDTIGG